MKRFTKALQNFARLERKMFAIFAVIPLLLSSVFFVSPNVFAASYSQTYWTNTTRFGQKVSLEYGNESIGYLKIHDVHGLDGLSGILALGTALENANVRTPVYDSVGNPIPNEYAYYGTLHSMYSAWVRVFILVGYGKVYNAYPTFGTQSSYTGPNGKSQFPWWVNDWVWTTQS